MTTIPPVRKDANSLFTGAFQPFSDVSWIGSTGCKEGICYGSEDGTLFYSNPDESVSHSFRAINTQEAINGVAFLDRWIMATSREQVALWTFPKEDPIKPASTLFSIGAHGVIASQSGYFIAPLGIAGLLFCNPKQHANSVDIFKSDENIFNHYHVATLHDIHHQEYILSALRKDGIGLMELASTGPTGEFKKATILPGQDIVDVCRIESNSGMLSFAALARDGTICLCQTDCKEVTITRIDDKLISGVGYRILSAHGMIFVLTSTHFYAICDLLTNFDSQNINQPISLVSEEIDAVDMAMICDEHIFMILPDQVKKTHVNHVRHVAEKSKLEFHITCTKTAMKVEKKKLLISVSHMEDSIAV